jgi:hypothetical protein
VPRFTHAEWAALIAGAAWLGGIAFGIRLGWRLCVRWAAEDYDGEEPEVILEPDLSLAASLPGPPPPGMSPQRPWWQLEYEEQYADVLTPSRFSYLAERVREYEP